MLGKRMAELQEKFESGTSAERISAMHEYKIALQRSQSIEKSIEFYMQNPRLSKISGCISTCGKAVKNATKKGLGFMAEGFAAMAEHDYGGNTPQF